MDYSEARAKGLCPSCGKPAQQNKVNCESCAEKKRIASQRRRDLKKNSGTCYHCDQPTESGKSYCVECLKRQKKERLTRKKKQQCRNCGKSTDGLSRCTECRQTVKRHMEKLKDEVFNQYGGYKCVCCGDEHKEFLTIDHIEGGGCKHRQEIGQSSTYRWLKQQEFPAGYQVLCWNCNIAKWRYSRRATQEEAD
jgi:hypothetical protein